MARRKTDSESGQRAKRRCHQRLVRRFPIDFRAIAAETGCTKGTIGHNSMFGWHVQNGNGPADFCTFTPPDIAEGETLRIEGREWAVYSANVKNQAREPSGLNATQTP